MIDGDQKIAQRRAEANERALQALGKMLKGLSGVVILFASAAAILLKLLADSQAQPELQRLQLSIFIMGMFVFLGISIGWFMFWIKEMVDDAAKHSEGRWQAIGWQTGKTVTAIAFMLPIALVSWGVFNRFQEFSNSLKAFEVHTFQRIEAGADR